MHSRVAFKKTVETFVKIKGSEEISLVTKLSLLLILLFFQNKSTTEAKIKHSEEFT